MLFITIFYFIFSNYIDDLKGDSYKELQKFDALILNLVNNFIDDNYKKIIEYLQLNHYDSNNFLVDNIISENNVTKKDLLINLYKINNIVDYSSDGYICKLFKIFNNYKEFCIIQEKIDLCILCKKAYKPLVEPYYQFFIIKENNIQYKKIFNILIENRKPHLIAFCSCNSENDYYLTTNTKYIVESFPDFLIVLIDMNYNIWLN